MSKSFDKAEIAKHNKADDLWVIIDNFVYDLSKFSKFHPGGKAVLLEYGLSWSRVLVAPFVRMTC